MKGTQTRTPTRLRLAVWPWPAEGIAVIPVIEGSWRTARPEPAPARPRRGGEAP